MPATPRVEILARLDTDMVEVIIEETLNEGDVTVPILNVDTLRVEKLPRGLFIEKFALKSSDRIVNPNTAVSNVTGVLNKTLLSPGFDVGP